MFFLFLDLPLNSGKTAVITGGTRGIGVEVIKLLLKCDINVIIGKKQNNIYLFKSSCFYGVPDMYLDVGKRLILVKEFI